MVSESSKKRKKGKKTRKESEDQLERKSEDTPTPQGTDVPEKERVVEPPKGNQEKGEVGIARTTPVDEEEEDSESETESGNVLKGAQGGKNRNIPKFEFLNNDNDCEGRDGNNGPSTNRRTKRLIRDVQKRWNRFGHQSWTRKNRNRVEEPCTMMINDMIPSSNTRKTVRGYTQDPQDSGSGRGRGIELVELEKSDESERIRLPFSNANITPLSEARDTVRGDTRYPQDPGSGRGIGVGYGDDTLKRTQSMEVELGNEPSSDLRGSESPFQNEEISILKSNITRGSKRKRRAITLPPQNKIALPFEKRKIEIGPDLAEKKGENEILKFEKLRLRAKMIDRIKKHLKEKELIDKDMIGHITDKIFKQILAGELKFEVTQGQLSLMISEGVKKALEEIEQRTRIEQWTRGNTQPFLY